MTLSPISNVYSNEQTKRIVTREKKKTLVTLSSFILITRIDCFILSVAWNLMITT